MCTRIFWLNPGPICISLRVRWKKVRALRNHSEEGVGCRQPTDELWPTIRTAPCLSMTSLQLAPRLGLNTWWAPNGPSCGNTPRGSTDGKGRPYMDGYYWWSPSIVCYQVANNPSLPVYSWGGPNGRDRLMVDLTERTMQQVMKVGDTTQDTHLKITSHNCTLVRVYSYVCAYLPW